MVRAEQNEETPPHHHNFNFKDRPNLQGVLEEKKPRSTKMENQSVFLGSAQPLYKGIWVGGFVLENF